MHDLPACPRLCCFDASVMIEQIRRLSERERLDQVHRQFVAYWTSMAHSPLRPTLPLARVHSR
jgi:hypothetical protein